MKKIISFLRWEFRGCTKSASFYGGLVSMLGVVMIFAGCPQPYPIATTMLGLAITLSDIVYSWFKFRVKMYQLEQESITRKLQKD